VSRWPFAGLSGYWILASSPASKNGQFYFWVADFTKAFNQEFNKTQLRISFLFEINQYNVTECKCASNSLCFSKICTDLEYVLLNWVYMQEDFYNLFRVTDGRYTNVTGRGAFVNSLLEIHYMFLWRTSSNNSAFVPSSGIGTHRIAVGYFAVCTL